jgi:YHS domain-containing protein
MTMQPNKTHHLARAAVSGLVLILPVVMITATAVAQVRDSGTIRTGQSLSQSLTGQSSTVPGFDNDRERSQQNHTAGNSQTTGQPRIISQVPDDSAPYLKAVPKGPATSANRSIIQRVGNNFGTTHKRQATHVHSHRTAPKVGGGFLDRLFGMSGRAVDNRRTFRSKDGTVYTPFDGQPNPQKSKPTPTKPQRAAAVPAVAATVVQSPFVPAPVSRGATVVNRVRRTDTSSVQPDEDSNDLVVESSQVATEMAGTVQTPVVVRHLLDFPNPFDDAPEAEADRVVVQQPVEPPPAPAADFEIVEESPGDEIWKDADSDSRKDADSDIRYQIDPTLSPYTGVTLDDEPFEATPQKPRPFPGIKLTPLTSSNAMRRQMVKRVSNRSGVSGLKGFCPIALLDHRDLVDTKTEFKARFGLRTYNFSSAESKQRFERNPTRYLPVAGGNDVVRMSSTDKEVIGKLDHAAWFRGRLYLFESDDTRQTFFEHPARFVDLY